MSHLIRHARLFAIVVAIDGCDDGEPSGPSDPEAPGGKADDASTTQPWVDVVFNDGYQVDTEAHWTPEPEAVAQRVTWSVVLQEGDRILSTEVKATSVVGGAEGSAGRVLSGDFFFDLEAATDSMTDLRTLVLQIDVESCGDAACDTAVDSVAVIRRPLRFLARPYPDAQLRSWGQANDLGALDEDALDELSDAIARTRCSNVLVVANGTTFEGMAGADAAWHFMRDRGYDCLVSVAYHDRDSGWGSLTSDDTLKFCESAELGKDALEPVWEAAVVQSGVEQWDIFGHSKGGAAAIKFYQRRWSDLRDWPASRVYTIGVPWRMGAQYLPTPDAYRPGEIYGHDQIVAFTWTNDAVRNIDQCLDLDVLWLSETHDYTPMFSKSIDDDPERTAIRDAYLDGTKTWVGDRY